MVPIIGHHIAAGKANSDTAEKAKHAAAVSTERLIFNTGGAGGFLVQGPAGALGGGAVWTSATNGIEYGISRTNENPDVGRILMI